MCKRLYFLISFILVLSLISSFSVALADGLVHRYSFTDGDTGAVDSVSGKNGTLVGDAFIRGNQLNVDGVDDWADLPAGDIAINTFPELTLELWSTQDTRDQGWSMTVAFGDTWPPPAGTGRDYIFIATSRGTPQSRGAIAITPDEDAPWSDETGINVAPEHNDNMQHHYVLTVTNDQVAYYVDGVIGTTNGLPIANTNDPISGLSNVLGYLGKGVYALDNEWRGMINEFRMYDIALTAEEVLANFNTGPNPEKASNPSPSYEETLLETNVTLSWTPGEYADKHNVYLGTDLNVVHDANVNNPMGVLVEQNQEPNNYPVSDLIRGTTYYVRIDEVRADGTTIDRGDIWNFTVKPFIAYNPTPPDDAEYVDVNDDLIWSPGALAASHDVYLGTNPSSLSLLSPAQDANTYDPGPLNYDTTYYWRIDEVNDASIWTGDVWSFKTNPFIPITNTNLIGWWKFDKGEGTVAVDSSGYYNHGTVINASWIDGYEGNGLYFNGVDASEYVDLPIGSYIASMNSCTIMTWVNFVHAGYGWQRIFDFGSGEDVYMFLSPRIGIQTDTNRPMRFAINSGSGESLMDAPSTLETGWHHVAVVIDSGGAMRLYLDGGVVANGNTTSLPSDLGNTTQNWLGRSQFGADGYLNGSLDDFRIYNYAMTTDELLVAMRVDPLIAWNPSPEQASTPDIEHVLPLSWSPGEEAAQHYVYFGTDPIAVEDANESDTTGIYRGMQLETTYTPSEALQRGQTYYWRIDEYNNDTTVSKGKIWSFMVANYLVVDNFEDYNDFDDRIFYTWIDGYGSPAQGIPGNGTGSTVGYTSPNLDAAEHYAETIVIHEGFQSMPMGYNNTVTPYYSQADRSWDTPQDWTREETASLTLWLQGYPQSVGGISYNATTQKYTMSARGTDINDVTAPRETGFHDEFHFAYKQLSGAGEIIAKIESVDNTEESAKAGVMIRNTELDTQTTAANSSYAMVYVTPGEGVAFQYRTLTGDAATIVQEADISAPHWVRLTRSGNTFTAYHSEDGQTWLSIGDAVDSWMEIPTMNANTYIGLALTSSNPDSTCEAVFSNVSAEAASGSTITPAGPFTQSQDVGIFSNDADSLYVILKDSDDNSHLVEHPDPNATQISEWQEWNIDLREFSSMGVNLEAIKKMSIGVGDPEATLPSGEGKIYIDDIRIYPPRCVAEFIKPVGDFNDNCVVDYFDLQILSDNWLINGGWDVTPVAPGDANLVAHYEFNGNFNDSSNGYHGDANGASIFTDPIRGQVARFDGVDDYIELPIGSVISSLTNCTFATWVNFLNVGGTWQRIFDFGSDTTYYIFLTPRVGEDEQMRSAITIGSNAEGAEQIVDAADTLARGWHHVAVTIDADNDTIGLYLDGLLVDENTTNITPSDLGETTNNWLGRSQWEADGYFNGSLDDFRIYDRVLTLGEIGSLAGRTAGYTQPLEALLRPQDSSIDMNSDNTIDFKDYVELVSTWLEEETWPQL